MKVRSGRAAEDRVFHAVLDAILDHRLAPGTRLAERELSELLGASRGAVRAALAVKRINAHLSNLEGQLHLEEEPQPAAKLSEALINA